MVIILEAFKDEGFRSAYLMGAFAVLILPMVALSWWYHTNIGKTPGGRHLMKIHNAAPRHLASGVGLARDISRGRYGSAARTMQTRVYWIVGLWILAVVVVFGLLLWADELNKAGVIGP